MFARLKASGAVNKDIIKLEQKFIRLAETAKKQRVKDENKQGEGQYSVAEGKNKYADYDKPITINDIRILRSIGRKSINDFTSEDIEKAQKWAYKFYQQLGEKLFGNDMAGLEKLLQAMEPKQRRTFMEFIKDFLKYLKEKFVKDTSLSAQIERFEKQFIEAYQAAETKFNQKNAENNGGDEYAINVINITKSDIEQNLSDIANMQSVSDLSGNEFSKGETDLITQVDNYFKTFNYSVQNSVLGDVDITARGAKDSISHGIGRNKAIAFSAVPAVIENGKIIDYQKNWKNRGYDTVVLAAPITIKGVPYYEGVIVLRDNKTQRFYVHEVITEKRTDMSFKTGTNNKVGESGDTSSPSIISLLDKIRIVKENLTEEVDGNNISQNTSNDTDSAEFLYVGEKSNTADKLKLSTAKQMLKDGADSETIRKKTGWFKGMDGKWRFEINDKDMKLSKPAEDYIKAFIEFAKVTTEVLKNPDPDDTLRQRYKKAYKEYERTKITETTLGELIKHDALFEAYPELKDYKVEFKNVDARAQYSVETKSIAINESCPFKNVEDCMKSIIHEIQHAIQHYEGFALGSSNVLWQIEINKGNIPKYKSGRKMDAKAAYRHTAGEIEARDVAKRIGYDDTKRENTRPDIDNKNVIFSDEVLKKYIASDVQYSIPSDHNYVYTNGKASFTEERLNSLFDEHSLGDGKRAEHSNAYVAYISPEDFVNLTANKNIRGRVEDEAYILNEDELKNEKETPFLEYDSVTGEVVGHEGRHRMVALKADGIKSVAIVLKPSTDSFERRTVQDISLSGQNFAGGKASGNVTVKNAIPLSEKYRTEAVAQFAQNPDADIRYSIPMRNQYSSKQINQNIQTVASMESVYTVPKERLEKSGKRPSDIFAEFFSSLGNSIYTDEFGEISLGKSSVKSEIRHGVTAEKIASIEAIPSALKQGKVIFSGNKPNSDVERIVVCAPINIGTKPYYMGVMLQRDSQNQRLYLHNVILKEETTDTSQADLLTTGADDVNDHLFITSILQKVLDVKKDKFSLPMEDADALLDMYDNKQITREEFKSRLNQSRNRKAETPLDIARMTKEDANTTPPLKRKKGNA